MFSFLLRVGVCVWCLCLSRCLGSGFSLCSCSSLGRCLCLSWCLCSGFCLCRCSSCVFVLVVVVCVGVLVLFCFVCVVFE